MKTRSTLKRILLALLGLGVAGSIVAAQALTVSPARMELEAVDPGTTVEKEFLLVNEQSAEETFYLSVQNFEAQGESGTPSFSEGKDGLASWVKTTNKVTIKPGERMKVPFTIAVPQNAEAGGHFAAIFLTTTPPSATEGGQVAIGAKIGMLVLLTVSGDIKEEGGIRSFTIDGGSRFVSSLPVTFAYRFSNGGNDRVKPTGNLTIRNSIYWKTEEFDANPQAGNVLPKSTRKFTVVWGSEKALDPAAPFFDHVKYQWRNFALGLYFANLDLAYGTKGASSSSSLVLFVFPWQLVTILAVVLLVLGTVLRVAIRRYNKWIIKQARSAK